MILEETWRLKEKERPLSNNILLTVVSDLEQKKWNASAEPKTSDLLASIVKFQENVHHTSH